ncbi:hypothetical protein [Nostoc sp.]|uniref:hypothetical protein n=1 Tax=Nostoc sp. TaxID=1180 RepID=UPI002FF8633F
MHSFLISISDEWWNIEEILQTQFHTNLDLSLPITNLSGGEITKLFLAIGISVRFNALELLARNLLQGGKARQNQGLRSGGFTPS